MRKNKLLYLAVVAISLFIVPGCIPSDREIASEMSAERRAAYLEWKTMREQGRTKEARVDGPLALDDAIKLALQYNKQLQVAIQGREVARGERVSAYNVVLPSVTISGSGTRIENGRGNNDIDNYSTRIQVSQPIFEGESIPARLRQARLGTALADEAVRQRVQDLIATVAGYYYDVLLAQHMVEVQREALVSAEAQYRMVFEKKRQETATDYDVLRAQVDVANYQAQMISAQNDIDTNRVYMLKNMGVSQDSEITFSDKLEFLPMRPVFERAVELASGNRPDLRTAQLDARSAEEAVRIARSAFWPEVAGSFTQAWGDGWNMPGDSFGRDPWQAGLTASYRFGIDNVGNLHSAKATARQRQLDILDTQETALQEIRFQMNTLTNAEEQVKSLVVNQDAAREALRLVEVGYQAGVRTEVDVTDARKALTEVMGQYYEALNRHTKARLNLQLAMGVLGPASVTDGPIAPPTVPIANIEEFAATDYTPPTPLPMPTSERRPPVNSSPTPRRPISQAAPPAPIQAIPPAPVQVIPAATSPSIQAVPAVTGSPIQTVPASSTQPAAAVQSAPAPLFKVTVREVGSDAPELARLGQ